MLYPITSPKGLKNVQRKKILENISKVITQTSVLPNRKVCNTILPLIFWLFGSKIFHFYGHGNGGKKVVKMRLFASERTVWLVQFLPKS